MQLCNNLFLNLKTIFKRKEHKSILHTRKGYLWSNSSKDTENFFSCKRFHKVMAILIY